MLDLAAAAGSIPTAQRLVLHGDGVQDIALEVDDVRRRLRTWPSTRRGRASRRPTVLEDEHGVYEYATIRAYGDTTHTFVNRDRYRGVFAPGFKPLDPDRYSPRTFHPVGLAAIDHIVGNVEEGKMNEWVEFYQQRARLHAARSLRRQGHQHRILGADVEGGAERQRPDQVPDQRAGQGPAASRRSRNTWSSTAAPACSTSPWPPTTSSTRSGPCGTTTSRSCACRRRYYDMLPERVGAIDEDIDELAELGILVDRDDEGYMLQIFTKPVAGSADAVLRDHPAARLAAASARGISRRCSRRSSASRQLRGTL